MTKLREYKAKNCKVPYTEIRAYQSISIDLYQTLTDFQKGFVTVREFEVDKLLADNLLAKYSYLELVKPKKTKTKENKE